MGHPEATMRCLPNVAVILLLAVGIICLAAEPAQIFRRPGIQITDSCYMNEEEFIAQADDGVSRAYKTSRPQRRSSSGMPGLDVILQYPYSLDERRNCQPGGGERKPDYARTLRILRNQAGRHFQVGLRDWLYVPYVRTT